MSRNPAAAHGIASHAGSAGLPGAALVTNVLSHYRAPCFRALAERLPGGVTFYLLARDMAHRQYVLAQGSDGLPVMALPGWRWSNPPYDDRHLNDLRPILRRQHDLIILGGWDEPSYFLLWLWAVLRRVPLLFWVESTAYDSRRSRLKEAYKRLLLGRAQGCIVPGARAGEYCHQLGMPSSRIFVAPNATDRAFFSERAARLVPQRDRIRADLGLDGIVVLFVGRLVQRYKDVMTLLRACHSLERRGAPVTLLLAGDGPDRGVYERWVADQGCRGVRLLGALNHDQLSRCYAAADIFVLPSQSETWGFVLNEAMEFGLPLVISDAVGAGPDLVRDGENGFVFGAGDADALAGLLGRLAQDSWLRARMGRASEQIVAQFSPERWAEGVVQAVRATRALRGGSAPP